MTPTDRARLRALAQEAMDGPPGHDDAAQAALDAACDPQTVLALLDIADAAELARQACYLALAAEELDLLWEPHIEDARKRLDAILDKG